MILPRDASQQVHVGMEINTDQSLKGLKQGDLLFFGRKATKENKEKITHVAIYMGGGKIIHSSGKVKIESLKRGDSDFNEYRLNTFVRAKRPLEKFNEYGIPLLSESEWY
jgi:cell wall-associated NlpC family hydrolase